MALGTNEPRSSLPELNLRSSGYTDNCLTYLLPPENPLHDGHDKKELILQKVNQKPLWFEDLAAVAFHEAGFYEHAPPKLNIRDGRTPWYPEALEDLKRRPIGFCFRAKIALYGKFKPGGTDPAWPCYLVSEITPVTEPRKNISVPASPAEYLPRTHEPQAVSTAVQAHGRAGTGIEPAPTGSDDLKTLREEIATLRRDNATQAEIIQNQAQDIEGLKREAEISRGHVTDLNRKVSEMQTAIDGFNAMQTNINGLEAAYRRLLEQSYKDLRRNVKVAEQETAAAKRENDELRSYVKTLARDSGAKIGELRAMIETLMNKNTST